MAATETLDVETERVSCVVDAPHIIYEGGASDLVALIRNQLVILMAYVKELKAQAVEKFGVPGMRMAIGEIITCVSCAKSSAELLGKLIPNA